MNAPLPVGLEVPPLGKVKGVFDWHGDRYYWMANTRGWEVMRADTVERGKEVTEVASGNDIHA